VSDGIPHDVAYLTTLCQKVFPDAFSEGRTKDSNEGFPVPPGADPFPYTDNYDYLSDSDLEDEEPIEFCEQELPSIAQVLGSKAPPATTPGNPSQPSRGISEVENRRMLALNSPLILPINHPTPDATAFQSGWGGLPSSVTSQR
jgi:hypothetical protein